ncbi:hypothetical protein G5I_10525, partial [Acromyrmex echinatior]
RENSSSPETCNDRVCSTTSPGEMTSVRTCYCKHEENVMNECSNSILSPETSTALENAEKIVNNAKIQLMEVCATSTFDSAQQHRNTYLDEPPLDDEICMLFKIIGGERQDERTFGEM